MSVMEPADRAKLEQLAPLTDPARVRRAREGVRLTQAQLAARIHDRTGYRLSPAALSQIERGLTRPSAATLGALASTLDYPAEFFARRGRDEDAPGYFRSLRSTSARDRKAALAQVHLVHDFTLEVEQHLRLPEVDVPRLPVDETTTDMAPVEAARLVRRAWQLAPGPIPHVVQELERHGIVVVRLTTGTHKVDAFSVAYEDRPVVVLGDDKGKRARSRFDAGHELGHLVMHGDVSGWESLAERQAHAFAAEFLMPREDIEPELRADKLAWGRLLELKLRWGVSMQAILFRAKALGVIGEQQYVNWLKGISARGWRVDEPGDDKLGPPERSTLLERAVAHLESTGRPLSDLTRAAALPAEALRTIVLASVDARPRLDI